MLRLRCSTKSQSHSKRGSDLYRPVRWWCLLAALCLSAPAPAQFRFDTWGTDQGLPHRNLPRVLQTHDGYLWMTTADGLARFDGVRFVVFNTSNTEGLKVA